MASFKRNISRWFLDYPARSSVLGFLVLILSGTALLSLPQASTGYRLSLVDALFTATSAACVTGLAVVDTGTALSYFGQAVVLGLIQVGGLGIMTVSTLLLMVAGRQPGFMHRGVVQDTFTHRGDWGAGGIIREVIQVVLVVETTGILLLFFFFSRDFSHGEALYMALFHSVSAFCNAGFCLFSDSLISYRENWGVILTISVLIIAGGLGFLVLSELWKTRPMRRHQWRRVSLHTKLAVSSTVILILAGTLLVGLIEWHNTLGPLSLGGKLMGAFFQSITTRTAGFNTLPVAHLANQTLYLFMLLMFIGGCPGSCAGGVKTTTAASIFIMAAARLGGNRYPTIYSRTIPNRTIWKAINVVMLGGLVISVALSLILASELGGLSHDESRGKFVELFFEVVSAFGTVGLSADVTPSLSIYGKLIITLVMFIGRLGPLAIGVTISRGKRARYFYAEENIMVG